MPTTVLETHGFVAIDCDGFRIDLAATHEGALRIYLAAMPERTGYDRGVSLISEGVPRSFLASEIAIADDELRCLAHTPQPRADAFCGFREGFALFIDAATAALLRVHVQRLAAVAGQLARIFAAAEPAMANDPILVAQGRTTHDSLAWLIGAGEDTACAVLSGASPDGAIRTCFADFLRGNDPETVQIAQRYAALIAAAAGACAGALVECSP